MLYSITKFCHEIEGFHCPLKAADNLYLSNLKSSKGLFSIKVGAEILFCFK